MIRTHPIVEGILNEISPDYSQATAAEAVIDGWLEQRRPADADPGVVADAVYAAAREGVDPGPELVAQFAQAAAAQQGWDNYRVGLVNAAQLAREDRAGEIRGTTDKVLAALDSRLQTLVGQVRDLHPHLGGATTAQEAVTAGSQATGAWQTLTGLVDQYDHLRAAQAETVKAYSLIDVARHGFSYSGSEVADLKALWAVGMVADHLDVEPHWLELRDHMSHVLAGVRREDLMAPARAPRTQPLNREWPETRVMLDMLSMFWRPPDNMFERADHEQLQLLAEWVARPARPISRELGWVDSATWWPRYDDRVEHLLRLCVTACPWVPSVPVMRRVHQLAMEITTVHSVNYGKGDVREILTAIRDHHQLVTRES